MPSAFQVKQYHPKSYYHVYNRGAQGVDIFRDGNDYWIFRKTARKLQTIFGVRIDTFTLLPNHYHLLPYQEKPRAISKFMHSLGLRYTLYFNRKYHKSGRLCEERYKAVHLPSAEDVERVRKYILDNPINKGYLNWKHVGRSI